jgi:hypothetical protein
LVFVQAEVPLDLPLEAAKQALGRAVGDGGLIAESRRAVDEGLSFVMPVGPRGSLRPSKKVLVRLLPGRDVADRYVVPLRWEVMGSGGWFFPVFDGDLALAPRAELTVLSIVGSYDPPLGAVGGTLDRAVMSKVATRTMKVLLGEVADRLLQLQ